MKIDEQCVQFFCTATGRNWSDFYSMLDGALQLNDTDEMSTEQWLIRKLMKTIVENGTSVNDFKANKDSVKAAFDEEGRKNAGEFFTPEIWCKEGRKYFDKHIPNWHEYNVWDASCGSGNLMRTAGHPVDKLFLSTLQQDDVDLIKATPEYEGATVFQLDFLNGLDYDIYNTDFLDKLPQRLQEIIKNDEPLIFYMNPPYKAGTSKGTDVGRYMCDIGLNKPACDIFYQFLWRVMNFVQMFNLSNTWFGLFGPLTNFTGSNSAILMKEFERCFEFVDGMCLSAQEFSDTSDSIVWGIGCTLWKSRGGYIADSHRKPVVVDRKFKLENGEVGTNGKILYAPPREKLSTWVEAKDIMFYENAPLMTSHLTFKGSDVNVRVAPQSGRIATNALGTMMVGNTLTRSSDQSAVLSMPTTIQFTSITEENFWRCVGSYTFRRIVDAGWDIAKKNLSAPNTEVEGYDIWLRNAIVMFLFEWKSMMSAIRNVEWNGSKIDIRNKLFYCSADEVREILNIMDEPDEVLLNDLDTHPPVNEFILKQIEESKPYWFPEVKALYDFCKEFTLFSYTRRKLVDYKGATDAWDAGFQQVRAGIWNDEMEEQLKTVLSAARDRLRENMFSFGFVTGIEE